MRPHLVPTRDLSPGDGPRDRRDLQAAREGPGHDVALRSNDYSCAREPVNRFGPLTEISGDPVRGSVDTRWTTVKNAVENA